MELGLHNLCCSVDNDREETLREKNFRDFKHENLIWLSDCTFIISSHI